jgi:cytochrome c556
VLSRKIEGESMKKYLLALTLLGATLFAENTQMVDLKKNMQEMEVALAAIQKGFLYNNGALVKEGVKNLQERVKHIEPPSKKDEELLGRGNTYSYKYAKKESAKISVLSEEIWTHFERGEKYTAMNRYKETLKQCLACHKKIRRW